MSADALPIEPALPRVAAALADAGAAVLVAAPGAGKTTRVPLALLDEAWLGGAKIAMLEPRRLAARAAARRMAQTLGETVGETVGYRVRLDTRVGPRTRVEVLTDGLFLRRLQRDPELPGIGLVIFDEFHERGLEADLSLALCLEARAALRPDLRLLVMSATLDAAAVARLLGDAPVIDSPGRAYPVELRWAGAPRPGERLAESVAAAVRRALAAEPGSALVFLPGFGEIRRVAELLADLPPEIDVIALHGELPLERQDEAIRPAPPGRRKVVLATSIAETSLTIEGIRNVVDAGLARVPRFDPTTGMTRLDTVKASRAAAEQRAGRAGRLEPGVCWRLWSEPEHRARPAFATPEIREADLAPMALELARWGASDPARLAWLDPPPAGAYAQAQAILQRLGAIDAAGRLTAHGQAMAELGLHPRLAHMVLASRAAGLGTLACEIAALAGERDVLRASADRRRPADLRLRLELLRGDDRGGDRGALAAVRRLTRDLRQQLAIRDPERPVDDAGIVAALAWPDRVAQLRGERGQFRLANGRGATLPAEDPLAREEFLAVLELDDSGADARIRLAAPLARAQLEAVFAERIESREVVAWDPRAEAVRAVRERRLDALVLGEQRLEDADPARVAAAMAEGVRALGLAALPWSVAAESLRARIAFLRRLEPEGGWPDTGDAALLDALETWLGPQLAGVTRRAQLERIDLAAALGGWLGWERRRRLDELAPSHVAVPSGSRLPVDYADPAEPALAVRVQEMLGARASPRIAGGRVALTLRLLSPAGRPVATTGDLARFWAGAWAEVRREMRGRYPKHDWPEDPLAAAPTARAKRRPR